MMDYIDRLPGSEKAKIRKKMRSPAAYEALRERVKGPEDLEQEMKVNEQVAEVKFALETEPTVQQQAKEQIETGLREQGTEILEVQYLAPENLAALEVGDFTVKIEGLDSADHEQMILIPEGNVAEKIPVRQAYSEQMINSLSQAA